MSGVISRSADRHPITTPEALDLLVGREVAVSPWLKIDQARVDRFADATGDDQWIHVDPARAAHGPYGATIAHGFLTLSLLPQLLDAAIEFHRMKMAVNYGLNKVRFTAPVPVGSRIRVRAMLLAVKPLPDLECTPGREIVWRLTAELEGSPKAVCVAETVSRRYWGAQDVRHA